MRGGGSKTSYGFMVLSFTVCKGMKDLAHRRVYLAIYTHFMYLYFFDYEFFMITQKGNLVICASGLHKSVICYLFLGTIFALLKWLPGAAQSRQRCMRDGTLRLRKCSTRYNAGVGSTHSTRSQL